MAKHRGNLCGSRSAHGEIGRARVAQIVQAEILDLGCLQNRIPSLAERPHAARSGPSKGRISVQAPNLAPFAQQTRDTRHDPHAAAVGVLSVVEHVDTALEAY